MFSLFTLLFICLVFFLLNFITVFDLKTQQESEFSLDVPSTVRIVLLIGKPGDDWPVENVAVER